MTFNEFRTALDECNALREQRKARSMVFQVDSKEYAAKAFRRPLTHFYHWPFRHWVKVDAMLRRMESQVMDECLALGIDHRKPWNSFPHFRRRMGLDN